MPPGWIPREYRPDGPLYARRRLVFSGVPVERDALIPAGLIRSKVKHQRLWQTNQAGHEPRNTYERKPYGKPPPTPTALPAAPVHPGSVFMTESGSPVKTLDGRTPTLAVGEALDANELAALLGATEPIAEQVARTTPAVSVQSHRHKRR